VRGEGERREREQVTSPSTFAGCGLRFKGLGMTEYGVGTTPPSETRQRLLNRGHHEPPVHSCVGLREGPGVSFLLYLHTYIHIYIYIYTYIHTYIHIYTCGVRVAGLGLWDEGIGRGDSQHPLPKPDTENRGTSLIRNCPPP